MVRPSKSEYHNYYGERTTNPTVPTATNGDLYYNTANNVLMGYINGAWVAITTGSPGVQESYAELFFYPGACGDAASVKTLTFAAACKGNSQAIAALGSGQVKGAPFITVNATNGTITIGASGAGKYLVTVSVSMVQTTGAIQTYLSVRRNGLIPPAAGSLTNLFMNRNNTEANEYWTSSLSGLVNAAVGDVFDVVVSVATPATIRFYYVNFSMVRIGA
jgi:hypothetical protein